VIVFAIVAVIAAALFGMARIVEYNWSEKRIRGKK